MTLRNLSEGDVKVSKRKASSLQVFGHKARQQNIQLYVSPWKKATRSMQHHCSEPSKLEDRHIKEKK